MRLQANNQLGSILGDVLFMRLQAGGHQFIKLPTQSSLNTVFDAIHRYAGGKSVDQVGHLLSKTTYGKYLHYVIGTMSFVAHYPTVDSLQATIRHLQEILAESNCQKLTQNEADQLLKQISPLIAQPVTKGTLGALGSALYQLTQDHLKSLPASKNRQAKRQRFLAKAKNACMQIEATQNPADQRALASQLAEQLKNELRQSVGKNNIDELQNFWYGYELFMTKPIL